MSDEIPEFQFVLGEPPRPFAVVWHRHHDPSKPRLWRTVEIPKGYATGQLYSWLSNSGNLKKGEEVARIYPIE